MCMANQYQFGSRAFLFKFKLAFIFSHALPYAIVCLRWFVDTVQFNYIKGKEK